MCPRPPEEKTTATANTLIDVPTKVKADDHKPTREVRGGECLTPPPMQSTTTAQPTVHSPHRQPTVNKSINLAPMHKDEPAIHNEPLPGTKTFAALGQIPKTGPIGQTNITWLQIKPVFVPLNHPDHRSRNDPPDKNQGKPEPDKEPPDRNGCNNDLQGSHC